MREDSPSSIRGLLALQEVCHGIGGRIGLVFLLGHPNQNVADRVGITGNPDALQHAVAPTLEVRGDGLELFPRDLVIDGQPVFARGRDCHCGQGVVVAGNTP